MRVSVWAPKSDVAAIGCVVPAQLATRTAIAIFCRTFILEVSLLNARHGSPLAVFLYHKANGLPESLLRFRRDQTILKGAGPKHNTFGIRSMLGAALMLIRNIQSVRANRATFWCNPLWRCKKRKGSRMVTVQRIKESLSPNCMRFIGICSL